MHRRLLLRLGLGVAFSLVSGLLAAAAGEARAAAPGPQRDDCYECHESIVSHWQESAHGQATQDPIFQEAWQDQGSPPECMTCHATGYDAESGMSEENGIACSVCHSPQSAPHPEVVMPTDPSSRLCGTCHTETLHEWSESAHGEGHLTCIRCHNPHTTGLKVSNIQDLCGICHTNESHQYGHTAHAQEGLLCTDCHLRVANAPGDEGHSQRRHTFAVDLVTCNQCHETEMHEPVDPVEGASADFMWAAVASRSDNACPADENIVVTDQPEDTRAGPANYMLVAVVGMVFGVAVAPWAEGMYRRYSNGG